MSGLIGGSSSKTLRVQEFRASGTFTVPSGVKTVELFVVGGGGGGAASNSGAGGNIVKTKYDVSAKASCAVIIGAGGVGGGGGDTSFDGIVIAKGAPAYGVPSSLTVAPAGLPGGVDGFGGHGSSNSGYHIPANGGMGTNGVGGAIHAAANTGGGGGVNGNGGSGYVRVEWYE